MITWLSHLLSVFDLNAVDGNGREADEGDQDESLDAGWKLLVWKYVSQCRPD